MVVTYEDVIPTLIPNTAMQKRIIDGVWKTYVINPAEGYVVHDNAFDWTEPDEITGEEIPVLGHKIGECSCGANYDFTTTQVTAVNGQVVTAYGSREFYAIPASEVPQDEPEVTE